MAEQRKEDSEMIVGGHVALLGEGDFTCSKMRLVMVYNAVL